MVSPHFCGQIYRPPHSLNYHEFIIALASRGVKGVVGVNDIPPGSRYRAGFICAIIQEYENLGYRDLV